MAQELNSTGNDIKKGFKALAGGVALAGKNRVDELVAKQGYVAFKNEDAVRAFREKPEYKNWECVLVDGEYRFSPPKKAQSTVNLIEKYRELRSIYPSIIINIKVSDDGSAELSFITNEANTLAQVVIDTFTISFDENFIKQILPSLYYQLADNMVVLDEIKKYGKNNHVKFSSVYENNIIYIGNISDQQLQLVNEMKKFVDENYLFGGSQLK